jgi:RecA/RadA recombinase
MRALKQKLSAPAEMYQIPDLSTRLATEPTRRSEQQRAAEDAPGRTAPPIFESFEALLNKMPPLKWLVDGLIETPSTVLFFGPSGGGKSFMAVDLAAACTAGGEWYGGRKVIRGPTFYIAGEGRRGLLRRFQAWELARNAQIPRDMLYLSTGRIELDEDGATAVEAAIDELMKSSDTASAPVLVIIDTLARALPSGADENSAKDMGAFINVVDRIRNRFQCVVVIIHHTGQPDKGASNRARGSSALKAAMDAELSVSRCKGGFKAEWTKLKDLPDDPAPQRFVLESVDVGTKESSEPVESAAVIWRGELPLLLRQTDDLGVKTLHAALKVNGGPVTEWAWREKFIEAHWGNSANAKRTAFSRVKDSLLDKRLIEFNGDRYTLSGSQPAPSFSLRGGASSASPCLKEQIEAGRESASTASPPLRGEALRRPRRQHLKAKEEDQPRTNPNKKGRSQP